MQAQLHVTMTFSPVSQDPGWGNGLGTGPDMGSVPHTYFQMRHGCRMHLYNDAYQVSGWPLSCSVWGFGSDLQPVGALLAAWRCTLHQAGAGRLPEAGGCAPCCPEGQ